MSYLKVPMRGRRRSSGVALLTAVTLLLCHLPETSNAAPKPVMVYYMPWYVAKPYSSEWGWHWTMNHFNPDIINAAGQRQVASWYYPLIGPYDSADPAVLEYHVLLMKLAGVDGLIVDWYGPDDYLDYAVNNERTMAIFKFARKAGLKFGLCYEDQTIQQEITGGFISATGAIAHARQTMRYVQTNYFSDPSYLRWNDKPVLLNFGPQYFKTNSQWEEIFSALPATPSFFTEDNRLPIGIGAFNWPPMWLSQAPGTGGVLSSVALENYLTTFQQSGKAWPAYISSAFPRFHDIYQKAGIRDYWGYLGDKNGDILRDTLSRALTNSSAMAQIVTWNDYGEGTVVEPTAEYGFRDLGIIQDLRRQYLDAGFAYHTNDLALPARLYKLRHESASNAVSSAELDRVFTNIISGNLAAAGDQLKKLESKLPPETSKATAKTGH
jgi:glycosyl hydrolase family 71